VVGCDFGEFYCGVWLVLILEWVVDHEVDFNVIEWVFFVDS